MIGNPVGKTLELQKFHSYSLNRIKASYNLVFLICGTLYCVYSCKWNKIDFNKRFYRREESEEALNFVALINNSKIIELNWIKIDTFYFPKNLEGN